MLRNVSAMSFLAVVALLGGVASCGGCGSRCGLTQCDDPGNSACVAEGAPCSTGGVCVVCPPGQRCAAATGCYGAKDGGGGGAGGGTGGAAGTGGSGGSGSFDEDADGLSDETEGKNAPGGPVDTDGDGTPDYQDLDSDGDALPDAVEKGADWDGDGLPNWRDPVNNGAVAAVLLTPLSTAFNTPIGIDYHEPTNSVVLSVNYPSGMPTNFERVEFDGGHAQFSTLSGLTNEVKIATVRSGTPGTGFTVGELFVGNGKPGEIVRIAPDGNTFQNPWYVLPGGPHGLLRGSLYIDRTGVFGGDLIVVTTLDPPATPIGQVYRVTAGKQSTRLADLGVHLEGLITVPNAPARFGGLAGRILVGNEGGKKLFAIAADGGVDTYTLPVAIEDIDLVNPNENFFGVAYGETRLFGAKAADFLGLSGDLLLTEEYPVAGHSGLHVLRWEQGAPVTRELPFAPGSAVTKQWEHVTFAPAGIVEIPPIID